MRQQDRVAFFGALEAGVKAQYAAEKAALIEIATRDGAERYKTDGYGTITIAAKKPHDEIVFDPDQLLAWMVEHQPHNIVQAVRTSAVEALRKGCVAAGDTVVYEPTGEVLPFARVVHKPAGEPYASWTGGGDLKEQAQAWVADRAEELAAGLKAITNE